MSARIHNAAKDFRASIRAPREAISVSVFADTAGRYLRVLISPEFKQWVGPIPASFSGFRVVVDASQPISRLTDITRNAPHQAA